jgi:C4-dicarboxylate-specific signal transduction histidine kinase
VATLGEMASGLAHELNQPLVSVHFEQEETKTTEA